MRMAGGILEKNSMPGTRLELRPKLLHDVVDGHVVLKKTGETKRTTEPKSTGVCP